MLRRSNPWPSIVDLFSALLLLAFGGMMLLSGLVPHPNGEDGTESELHRKARQLMERVSAELTAAGMKAKMNKCGEDICIDVPVHFQFGEATIYLPNEKDGLRKACEAMKSGLDKMSENERKTVPLVIEGHTDPQPFGRAKTERDRFLGNWRLSAERAAAVLYEFKGCGLQHPDYAITSVGKADTEPDPICREETEECYEKHRRTTFRLQVDTRRLEDLKKHAKE